MLDITLCHFFNKNVCRMIQFLASFYCWTDDLTFESGILWNTEELMWSLQDSQVQKKKKNHHPSSTMLISWYLCLRWVWFLPDVLLCIMTKHIYISLDIVSRTLAVSSDGSLNNLSQWRPLNSILFGNSLITLPRLKDSCSCFSKTVDDVSLFWHDINKHNCSLQTGKLSKFLLW